MALGLFQLSDYERALRSTGIKPEFLPEDRGIFISVR
jgi:hypothetical protein